MLNNCAITNEGLWLSVGDVMINSSNNQIYGHEATCTDRFLQNHAKFQFSNKAITGIYLFL